MPKFRITVENPEYSDGSFAQVFANREDARRFEVDCAHIGLLTGLEVQYSMEEIAEPMFQNMLVARCMGWSAGDWEVIDTRHPVTGFWRQTLVYKRQKDDEALGVDRHKRHLAYLLHDYSAGYHWELTRDGFDWYADCGCFEELSGLCEGMEAFLNARS